MGPPASLKDAESILNQLKLQIDTENKRNFEIAEIEMSDNSEISGKSVAGIQFRQKYGVTLVGIRRGVQQITTINPSEHLKSGDCLIIIGRSNAVKALKEKAPI